MATKKKAARPAPPPPADGDTEQRILDAAHVVFVRRGTAGARMQDIAQEAGVNQALLHYYFRSKDRLAEAVFQRAAMQLMPPLLGILMQPGLTIAEKVARFVEHELTQLSRTPYLPGYVLSEMAHHPERAQHLLLAMSGMRPEGIAASVLAPLERQLQEEAARGAIRPIRAPDFLVTMASLCIFPFAARPLLCAILQWDQAEWDDFIARRRRELPTLIMNALQP